MLRRGRIVSGSEIDADEITTRCANTLMQVELRFEQRTRVKNARSFFRYRKISRELQAKF